MTKAALLAVAVLIPHDSEVSEVMTELAQDYWPDVVFPAGVQEFGSCESDTDCAETFGGEY